MSHARRLSYVLATTIAAIAGSMTFACHAATPVGDAPRTVVNYSDLDFTRLEDLEEMYGRIRSAASRVCRPYGTFEYSKTILHRTCKSTAIAAAVRDVGSVTFSAYYLGRTNRNVSQLASR